MKNARLILSIILLSLVSCASKNDVREPTVEEKKADLYYQRGTNFLVRKEYTEALAHLIKANQFNDEDTKTHNNLGMAYYFKGDKKKSLEHLKMSLELDPKNGDARNNLASIYFTLKQFDNALKQYGELLKDLTYQKQYRTYHNMGLIYLRKNRKDMAYKLFSKAVKEKEDYCPSYFQLGKLSEQDYSFHRAINFYHKATLGACFENPAPLFKQGEVYMKLGDDTKAFHKFKEIMEKFPTNNYSILAGRKLRALDIQNLKKNQKQVRRKRLPQNQSKGTNSVSF